ncbi:MAG: agarase, partial [Planctomycetota bacterium]
MMNRILRRSFLRSGLALVAIGKGLAEPSTSKSTSTSTKESKTTQIEPDGFFTLDQRNDRWWLIDPEGKPFFTMGMNHIDPASMRYPENIEIWRKKYGGSTIRWIQESVTPNLKAWGFNTVGWVQEVTVRGEGKAWQHSRAFTIDEYRALDMPYCHLLP